MAPPLRPVLWTIPLAFCLWGFSFGVPWGNFWLKITSSAFILTVAGLAGTRAGLAALFRFRNRDLWVGLSSALVLYGVFWLGKQCSTFLFPFAAGQIAGVYSTRSQLPPAVIGVLLVFVMGPAEEIYWHGFVQRALVGRLGPAAGVLLTAFIYAVVHIWSLNFMLFAAAGICGLFWGWLFQREQRLAPLILSHAIWDVAIFVLFPLN
jgi:uncharacterized protein